MTVLTRSKADIRKDLQGIRDRFATTLWTEYRARILRPDDEHLVNQWNRLTRMEAVTAVENDGEAITTPLDELVDTEIYAKSGRNWSPIRIERMRARATSKSAFAFRYQDWVNNDDFYTYEAMVAYSPYGREVALAEPELVETLIERLTTKGDDIQRNSRAPLHGAAHDSCMRPEAAMCLGRLGPEVAHKYPEVVEALAQTLQEEKEDNLGIFGRHLLEAVSEVGYEACLVHDGILDELSDVYRASRSPIMRSAAAICVGRLGSVLLRDRPKLVDQLLISLVEDPEFQIREASAYALRACPVGIIVDNLEIMESLFNALRSDSMWPVRKVASKSLAILGRRSLKQSERIADALIHAVNNDDEYPVRIAAVEALRDVLPGAVSGSPRIVRELLEVVREEPTDLLRAEAIRTLGFLGSSAIDEHPEVFHQLLELVRSNEMYDNDSFIPSAVIESLSSLGPSIFDLAPDLLAKMLATMSANPNPYVQCRAANVLMRIGRDSPRAADVCMRFCVWWRSEGRKYWYYDSVPFASDALDWSSSVRDLIDKSLTDALMGHDGKDDLNQTLDSIVSEWIPDLPQIRVMKQEWKGGGIEYSFFTTSELASLPVETTTLELRPIRLPMSEWPWNDLEHRLVLFDGAILPTVHGYENYIFTKVEGKRAIIFSPGKDQAREISNSHQVRLIAIRPSDWEAYSDRILIMQAPHRENDYDIVVWRPKSINAPGEQYQEVRMSFEKMNRKAEKQFIAIVPGEGDRLRIDLAYPELPSQIHMNS